VAFAPISTAVLTDFDGVTRPAMVGDRFHMDEIAVYQKDLQV
jgi:hypothetical protein